MVNIGCIYKITNSINQKSYIGYTTGDLQTRMRKHRTDDIGYDTILGRAIKKYGWENFTYKSVCEADDKDVLLALEIFFIQYFHTYKPDGYNMTRGGEKLYGDNNPFYGHKHTQQTREYLSNLQSQRVGDKNSFYGKHHSDATKLAIAHANSKPVAAYKDGQQILQFDSMAHAGQWCIEQGLTHDKYAISSISKSCRTGNKAYGYYWKLINEGVETMADECKPVE